MKLLKTITKSGSFWKDIPPTPIDKILHFNQLFNQDTNAEKVNLTIGAYRDDTGKPWNLPCVNMALEQMKSNINFQYLPPRGDVDFLKVALEIAYGKDSNGMLSGVYKPGQMASVQSLSGAGGFLLALQALKEFYKPLAENGNAIWMPNPTWPNHDSMTQLQGLVPKYYNYYDTVTRKFTFDLMLESLRSMPKYSVIILHPVGHNPTGFDPSPAQWKQILEISKEKEFFNIFDMAYQGFVSGDLEKDAYAVQLFAKNNQRMSVIQSFAKNFGLYGQRVGCMSIPNEDEKWVKSMNDFLGSRVRKIYSTNPRFGSDIVKIVLSDPKMRAQWDQDILTMSQRIINMRQSLYNEIQKFNPKQDWSYIIQQQGMFAYTHIKPDQVATLRDKHAIYMLEMGRVSICGINSKNVSKVAKCFHEVTSSQQY